MILQFNQIGRQPYPLFEGKIYEQVVISAMGSTHATNGYVLYDGQRIDISSTPHREKLNGKNVTQVTDLLLSGERIGYIYPAVVEQKKFLFISFGYGYFVFHFKNEDYTVYEVGLGRNQHYICVYKNGITIAIIQKDDIKVDFCDKYTIYAMDSSEMLALSVLTLYVDCVMYPDYGEIMDGSRIDDSCLTIQKELNEKYDPSFISKVKALDEKSAHNGSHS